MNSKRIEAERIRAEQLRAARELQEMFQTNKGGRSHGGSRYTSDSSRPRGMPSGTFSSSTAQRSDMYRPTRGPREKVFEFNSKDAAFAIVDADTIVWLKSSKNNGPKGADNTAAKENVSPHPNRPSKKAASGPSGSSKGNASKENVEPGQAMVKQGMSGHPNGSKSTTAKVVALSQPKQAGPKPPGVLMNSGNVKAPGTVPKQTAPEPLVKNSGNVKPQDSAPNQQKHTEPKPLEVIKYGAYVEPEGPALSNDVNKAIPQTGPQPAQSTTGQSSVTVPAQSIASGRVNDNGSSFLNNNGGQRLERDPGDANRLRLSVVDRFKLLELGWTAPPSPTVAPSLGLHKTQKSTLTAESSAFEAGDVSEVSYSTLDRVKERAMVEREPSFDAEDAPSSLQEPLVPAVESQSNDQVDLIEFPPEEGTLITVGTVNRGVQECLCKNPKNIKQAKGLSSSRWADPGYEHEGTLPSNSVAIVHEAGCPMGADWAKQRFLESGATAVTGSVQTTKGFNASAPVFQPTQKR